jgi:CRP/FNR family cyclic AMP-dependent transcriptional regulator
MVVAHRHLDRGVSQQLLAGPDDQVVSRGTTMDAPRDNVIFELGLFMGAIARARTFLLEPTGTIGNRNAGRIRAAIAWVRGLLIKPGGVEVKLPSDLKGINTLRFVSGTGDLAAAVGPVVAELAEIIKASGPK